MRIRMVVFVSGTRDGEEWPNRGTILNLPDDEARAYVAAGMAEPVTDFRDAETAVAPKVEERQEDLPKQGGLTTATGPTKGPKQRSTLRVPKEG